MLVQEYIKNIMKESIRKINSSVDVSAPSKKGMLQAMNPSLSNTGLEQLEAQMEEVRKNLEAMYQDVVKETEISKAAYEELYQQVQVLTQMQTESYQKVDEYNRLYCDLENELFGLKKEKDSLTMDYNRESQELQRLNKELEEARKKRKKQEDRLKTWFWVPGYGLYLSIDYLSSDLEAKIKVTDQKISDLQKLMDSKNEMIAIKEKTCSELSQKVQDMKQQIESVTENIKSVTADLNQSKYEMVCWKDLKKRLEEVQAKLTAGKGSPDTLLEVLDMLEGIGEAV